MQILYRGTNRYTGYFRLLVHNRNMQKNVFFVPMSPGLPYVHSTITIRIYKNVHTCINLQLIGSALISEYGLISKVLHTL